MMGFVHPSIASSLALEIHDRSLQMVVKASARYNINPTVQQYRALVRQSHYSVFERRLMFHDAR